MSLCRRHRYIPRVSGAKKEVWEVVYLKSKPIGFNFYSSLLFARFYWRSAGKLFLETFRVSGKTFPARLT
jgi:hypothetical protein